MSTLSKKLVAICLVTTFSMVMYGCGGGGGSSDDEMMTGGGDTTMTPIDCPDGQEPNAANDACVPNAATLAAMAAAATKAAATKTMAIADEKAQGTVDNPDAGLGGSDNRGDDGATGTNDDPYKMEISRDRAGTTVKITDDELADDDDPKFMEVRDLMGGTTMHSRKMAADNDGNVEEEVVIVSTDIEAPKGVAFAKWQGRTDAGVATMPQDLDVLSATGQEPGDGETANALNIPPNADTTVKPNLMFARSTTNGILTYVADDDDTNGVDEALHDGTYNGAEGTYRCTGTADCTVTFNDKGMVTGHGGAWVFIPDEGATSDQPDYDYLHYGVWLKKTTDSDGAVEYDEVETFAGSSIAASGSVASVRGRATYSGGATGVYVHQVRNPAGKIDSATSGHFTADVALVAHFADTTTDDEGGAGQIAANLQNTISGTINNFMLSGHDQGPGWLVSLEKSNGTDTGGVETGVAKGGGDEGSYTATYHGPTTDNAQPHSVVGEFNAFFSNGSVAGAFGARKD